MKAVRVGLAVLAVGFGLPVWATTFYASPNGTGDGLSDQSPTTLADAVAKASAEGAGAVVQLADGTYEQTAQVTIAADITVQGASREGTIVTAIGITDKNKFRLFTLNSSGAVLKDMTVENGNIGGSGGNILIDTNGGLVKNCVIRNGAASGNGNGGGGIALYGGEVVDSIITNNTFDSAQQYSHSCGAVFFKSCTKAAIRRCVVARNFAKCGGNATVATAGIGVYDSNARGVVIDSCTIAYNSGSACGGIYFGTSGTIVTNCLFTGNVARRKPDSWKDFYNGSVNNMTVVDCFFDEIATVTGKDGQTGYVSFADESYAPSFASANVGKAKDGSDIGAVQHGEVMELTGFIDAPLTQAAAEYELTFTAYATDADGGALTECVWDFGDDSASESGASVTHAYAAAGTYELKATVTVNGAQKVLAKTVEIGPAEIALTSGGDIKAAVESAYAGATVRLGPGNYTLNASGTMPYDVNGATAVVMTRPIKVIADSDDPYDTVITVSGSRRAFYLADKGAFVAGVTVKGGKVSAAYHYGGAFMLDYGTVSNCVAASCSASSNGAGGAGVGLYDGLVTHSIISNNTSKITQYDNNGGAVNIYGGTVRNCLICNNTGKNDDGKFVNVGGVSMHGGTLESCTVAGNSGPGCGGVWVRVNTAKVLNCAIHDNTSVSATPSDAQWKANGGCFNYCVSTVAITGGKNCTVGNVNTAGLTTGDWRPLVGSATIGAGSVQSWMAEAADLDGNPMVVDDKTDAGCYQYQSSYISGFLNVDIDEGVQPLTVALTASGDCVDTITSYEWIFGDGATLTTTEPTVTHEYTGVGSFKPSVRMIVASTGKSASVELANEISVGCAHFYVTAAENPNAEYPWDSWEKAATNIAEVLPHALNTAVITMSEGTHRTDGQIALTRGVTVEGAGPEKTVVAARAGSANHRMFLLNHAGANVRSLTAQGTGVHLKDSYGSVMLVESFGGTVSNCVIRGGRHDQNGYAGAGILLYAGTITHSVVRDNAGGCTAHGYDHSGGALCLWGPTAVAEYCLVTSNRTWCGSNGGGSAGGIVMLNNGGKVRNCTVVGNYAGDFSGDPVHAGYAGVTTVGGTSGNSIVNCLIANNTSEGESVSPRRRVANDNAINVMRNCATDVDVGRAAQGCVYAEDMQFVDPGNGDWRPSWRSVAVKGADPTVIKASLDLSGRPVFSPSGRADIGAYRHVGDRQMLFMIR